MSILAFRDVDAFYGQAQILSGVSFAVDAGERVALVGRNGVGKTTVVETLCGGTRVRGGEILIRGQARRELRAFTAAKSGIGVVLQGRGILPNLTVTENILLGAATGRKGRWNLDAVMALFPALAKRSRNPGPALSGGEQQMLAIGRALMANPDLLVLDEPSEGLAPVIVDMLSDLMLRLAAEGTGILLIEQNVSLIRRVADRFYVLSKGRVVAQGHTEGLSNEDLMGHILI